jgi:hypothetical protein
MQEKITDKIIKYMKKDLRREYTIPEIMREINVKNREKVVVALTELTTLAIIEISREKGRTPYYRIKETK